MIISPRQWEPVVADLRGSESNRAPDLLNRIVAQFDVMNQVRYAAVRDAVTQRLKTWCATFVWDVTSAMGCEIPHWIANPDQKMVGAVPRVEINANKRHEWLKTEGPTFGWLQVEEGDARAHANGGCPAVASWLNETGGPGHEAVLKPRAQGSVEATYIAQAGAHNFAYALLSAGFGSYKPRFFIHA